MIKNTSVTKNELLVFGFDISRFSKLVQFVICVGGVFFFYLLYGYYQEKIFQIDGFKPYGLFLTLVQFIFYSCFSTVEIVLTKKSFQRSITFRTYVFLAFLTVSTMGMSNASLGYLNYPTQVIFKCCKLIPVMFGGILVQGKKFQLLDFLACILMSVGLTFFILADSLVQPNFDIIGILMMSVALCSDAVIGNLQEKSMKSSKASNAEVVLYSYGIGCFYIFGILLVSGQLRDGFSYYLVNAKEKYLYSLIFSFTGYLGITFVLTLVRAYGALAAVTVTTCRKAVTIVISFTLFSKPFTMQYVWSGLIVLLGILINIYQKNRNLFDAYVIKFLSKIQQNFELSSTRRTIQEV